MPLKGQAKTDYQREYMRRRRAGLSAPPKAPAAQDTVRPYRPRPPPTPEEKAARELKTAASVESLKAAVNAGLSAELAAAKARIAELERELQEARAAKEAGGEPEPPAKRQAAEARKAVRAAARAAKQAASGEQEEETVETLRDKLELRDRQIKGLRTQIKRGRAEVELLRETVLHMGKTPLDDAGYRLIAKCLHPDRGSSDKERGELTKAFQAFNALGLRKR